MNEPRSGSHEAAPVAGEGSAGTGWVTLVAAAIVVLLALGAAFLPHRSARSQDHTLLVFDSSGSEARLKDFLEPLRDLLSRGDDAALQLKRVTTIGAFQAVLATEPDFVLAPDGVALGLSQESFLPLAVGRRPAPYNLRPRSVLVFRRAAGELPAPWLTRPAATALGDSLSLVGTGVLRQQGLDDVPAGCVCGPDPYDHGPVLHALRLEAFDYALVRQWDAERFFKAGLLDPAEFGVRKLVAPVPDMVLMVSRQVPQGVRLRCGERLSELGRQQGRDDPLGETLSRGLAGLHLVGFNLLLAPDLELVRQSFPGRWLPGVH